MTLDIQKEIDKINEVAANAARAELKLEVLEVIDKWSTVPPKDRTPNSLKSMILEL